MAETHPAPTAIQAGQAACFMAARLGQIDLDALRATSACIGAGVDLEHADVSLDCAERHQRGDRMVCLDETCGGIFNRS